MLLSSFPPGCACRLCRWCDFDFTLFVVAVGAVVASWSFFVGRWCVDFWPSSLVLRWSFYVRGVGASYSFGFRRRCDERRWCDVGSCFAVGAVLSLLTLVRRRCGRWSVCLVLPSWLVLRRFSSSLVRRRSRCRRWCDEVLVLLSYIFVVLIHSSNISFLLSPHL